MREALAIAGDEGLEAMWARHSQVSQSGKSKGATGAPPRARGSAMRRRLLLSCWPAPNRTAALPFRHPSPLPPPAPSPFAAAPRYAANAVVAPLTASIPDTLPSQTPTPALCAMMMCAHTLSARPSKESFPDFTPTGAP
jgi:hypothetical protein